MKKLPRAPRVPLTLALCLLSMQVGGAPAVDGGWTSAKPGYAWSFPADHWSHPGYKTEWWYFTGQLESEDVPPRSFGYQLTFFRVGVAPEAPALDSSWSASDLVMTHAAVTDFDRGTHRFEEALYRAIPLLGGFGAAPDPLIAWTLPPAGSSEPWTLRWTGESFELSAGDENGTLAIRLVATPAQGLTLQGPGGYSRKGRQADAGSLYYSFTRLETSGSLSIGGQTTAVAGTSWMDHEISSKQLEDDQVGWDWLSLQLDDGRDLMIYRIRGKDGSTDFSSATLVSSEGVASYLDAAAWTFAATGNWTSPSSGVQYPSGWRLELPGHDLHLVLEPRLVDQENRARIHYWEGAVTAFHADGSRAGQGYVELTGYGTGNRPRL